MFLHSKGMEDPDSEATATLPNDHSLLRMHSSIVFISMLHSYMGHTCKSHSIIFPVHIICFFIPRAWRILIPKPL